MDFSPVENKYGCVGLYNLGNTCYMNSSLQVLKNIYPLTEYIILENKNKEGKIIEEYTNLLYNLISKNNNLAADASEFKNALSKYDSYFLGNQQKDCTKCITSILSALNIDLKRNEPMTYNIINKYDEEEKQFTKSFNKIVKRKNSIIFDLFFGFIKISYKCQNCDYKKIVFQCFNYLDISVIDIDKRKKINNLEDCIKYYEKETKSEYKCDECKEGEIIMKNTIYKLPKILIFSFNRVYNEYHLNHTIDYPECFNSNDYFEEKPNLLFKSNLSQQNQYSLNGIIIHYGSADSGHKTAFCKNFFNNNWYFFNDSFKYLINDKNEILNEKDAFLLIYQNEKECYPINKENLKSICDKNRCENDVIYNYYNKSYDKYYHYDGIY
jgi:ubiquitin C-terminal hydrolase